MVRGYKEDITPCFIYSLIPAFSRWEKEKRPFASPSGGRGSFSIACYKQNKTNRD
jgi:hypothetical protein